MFGARRGGLDHGGHHAGVGRDDEVLAEAPLEAQAGDAERAVLVVELRVRLVVPGLPRCPTAPRARRRSGDLPVHDAAIRVVEDGPIVGRHDEQRHQVLEHRAAPRQEHGAAPRRLRRQLAPEAEPVLLGQLPLRDGHEARQPRLRGQQVVEARVEAVIRDVVPDCQELPAAIVEELVLEARRARCTARRGGAALRCARGGPGRGLRQGRPQPAQPIDDGRRGAGGVARPVEVRRPRLLETGRLGQRGQHAPEARERADRRLPGAPRRGSAAQGASSSRLDGAPGHQCVAERGEPPRELGRHRSAVRHRALEALAVISQTVEQETGRGQRPGQRLRSDPGSRPPRPPRPAPPGPRAVRS